MPSPLVFSESIFGPVADGSPGFRCTLRQSGGDAAWVRVIGELDIATAPQLEQTLRKAQLRARRVVLDLRQLTFIDCAGINVLLATRRRARLEGGSLRVLRASPRVLRIIALTRLQHVLMPVAALPEAAAS